MTRSIVHKQLFIYRSFIVFFILTYNEQCSSSLYHAAVTNYAGDSNSIGTGIGNNKLGGDPGGIRG